VAFSGLLVVDETERHTATPARRRARPTISSSFPQSASLAAWSTLVRPPTRGRSRRRRPAKSTETPPAPATSGIDGIRLGTFSFTTGYPPPCDSSHTGGSRQPRSTRPSALRLAY